jgi:hypothetical protein
MKTDDLLHQILPILHSVKDDEEKLQQILDFLMEEIYEEPEEEVEIPEKYKKLVKETAGSIDAGFVCYINPDTLETEDIPANLMNDPHDFMMATGYSLEDYDLKHDKWEKVIVVAPLESRESFWIMERFADQIPDMMMKQKVIQALQQRRPFANFKNIIDNSDYRMQWFAFKQKQLEEHVWEEIAYELKKDKSED